jgi:predicted amidohydrolase
MRVAVSQFTTSSNTQENLATCIRMINETAVCKPSLMVLPEYCNTQPYYVDHKQAWSEALAIDGPFLQAIAAQAEKHQCYIALNVTLRRDLAHNLVSNELDRPTESEIKLQISVTTCLFSPSGDIIHQADKQTLTEHEKVFFISRNNIASHNDDVIKTPLGKFGFLSGNDDMTFDESRELILKNVQLLCHSNSAFSLDQSHIHGPTRACENKVFLACANKIGPLVQTESMVGIGQSQIVSPEGKILAKIESNEEGFTFADIDLAESNNKHRPDGTDIIQQRRTEIYQALTQQASQANECDQDNEKVPLTTNVAIFATYKSNEQAIDDVCHYIENNLSDIIQLPELFFISDKKITHDAQQLIQVEDLSKQVIEQVSSVLRPFQYLCTSLVMKGQHQAVIISQDGILACQQQLHFCQRYQWTELGDSVKIIDLPLEQGNIRLAMLTADDAHIPEIVKLAATKGIHLLLVPFDIQAPCEVEYSLLAGAIENRICIVAASREKSFAGTLSFESDNSNDIYNKNKVKAQKSTGVIINLTTDSSLLPQWKSPKFSGYINQPLVKYQYGKITKAVIHPVAACTKN